MGHAEARFRALQVAILTVSDSRTLATDTSGQYLADAVTSAGHRVVERKLIPDHRFQLRAVVSQWIFDESVEIILVTGGTGITGRDGTPEAISPLLEKSIEGFGELFRHLSLKDIGAATLQSRALAGTANGTIIFCMPGSTHACQTAWDGILASQLDARTKPCNLVALLPRLREY